MFIYALVSKVYLTGVGDVGDVLAGLAGWVCLWTTQWLVLRKKLGWGGWWAAANLVGYTAALIASAYLAEAVEPHLELFTRNKQTIQVVSRTLMWVLVLTGNALLTGWIVPRLLMKHWLKAQPAVAPQSDPLVEPSVMEERITE